MSKIIKPHKDNFCGGNFKDWLEVLLTKDCNGICTWCVEKGGYHPKKKISPQKLAEIINKSKYKNIILLGGEPTLYNGINILKNNVKKNLYITTNGSNFDKLYGFYGVNISIHDCILQFNNSITGINIDIHELFKFCKTFKGKIRFNCNLIKEYIDTRHKILNYIRWAKDLGVKHIRFAELKNSNEKFVNLGKLFNYKYGLNENPFIFGCNKNTIIDGVKINFRQMCGFQTKKRKVKSNYKSNCQKIVLYYDGKFYNGWKKEKEMKNLEKIKKLKKEIQRLTKILNKEKEKVETVSNGGYCKY